MGKIDIKQVINHQEKLIRKEWNRGFKWYQIQVNQSGKLSWKGENTSVNRLHRKR